MESYKIKPNAPSLVEEPISAYLQMTAPSSGPMWIINASRKGVLMKEVLDLMHHLSISLKEISTIFHLSLRTLQRYAPSKRLDSDTSAKALQLVTLQLKGRDVFGSDDAFSLWIHSTLPSIDNQKPIDLLDTPFGFDLISQMLGRIEHGIFS